MNSIDRLHSLLAGECPNYIFPYFWQHGEDEATLRHYMHVIRASNIHAVCVESRPHPDFLGEKWWADMDAILDEAQKLSMKVWILDDEHFPQAMQQGRWRPLRLSFAIYTWTTTRWMCADQCHPHSFVFPIMHIPNPPRHGCLKDRRQSVCSMMTNCIACSPILLKQKEGLGSASI